ncbi:MAG: hypothetical protein ACYTAS_02845 [Planctomycetota bacterium]|jgi:hypothetical protein
MWGKWLKRTSFVVVFVPVHVLLMAFSYFCAVNSLWPKVCNVMPLALSFPLFLLLVQLNPDGDRTPVWL